MLCLDFKMIGFSKLDLIDALLCLHIWATIGNIFVSHGSREVLDAGARFLHIYVLGYEG